MGEVRIIGRMIKNLISTITKEPQKCGFETFIITKTAPRLKKIRLVENGGDSLRLKLKECILQILEEKYLVSDWEYVSADWIADEQKKFYIIETGENYDPLSVLNTEIGVFSKNDINDATGIAFAIRTGNKQIWAYQHLWSILVPNKSKKNILAKIVSKTEGDVFEEQINPILTFTKKIDLLVVDNYIIASDYKLLQNSFGFQDYIQIRAERTIVAIQEKGLVANIEKLRDYVQRGNGKPKYAKKMMRIADSKVLKMEPEKLWENIHKSIRWNGKIKEANNQFILDTYTQVENLIDLLDERYTRSDITDIEYDTDVKHIANPVSLD